MQQRIAGNAPVFLHPLPFTSFSVPPFFLNVLCFSGLDVLRMTLPSFDIAFSDGRRGAPLKSVLFSRSSPRVLPFFSPPVRFYYSVNWFLSTRPPLSLEKSTMDKKRRRKCYGKSDKGASRRERRDQTGRRRNKPSFSLLFARIQFPAVFA